MVSAPVCGELRFCPVADSNLTRTATCFATCPPGLEPVLHREVAALRLGKVERQVAGVRFDTDLAGLMEVNLRLRTAIRVLRRLASFTCRDADELYQGVSELPWSRLMRPDGRLWIDARVRDSELTHSQFVAQRTKDAIVDALRGVSGQRPTVDREEPDLRIDVHLVRNRVTVSLDSTGRSLHRRGWRRHQGVAPLSECLAAGMVRLSEWDERAPLVDPFCGTGTIVVEAGLIACGIAPGSMRRDPFAFESWPGFDPKNLERLRERLERERRPLGKRRLVAWDRDAERVEETREHLASAGIEGSGVLVEQRPAEDFDPVAGWNATVVTNPPYGERIGDEDGLRATFRAFGERLRERGSGFELALLSGNPRLAKALALRFDSRTPLPNGGLETELLRAAVR